jgi:hypothetical protein
MTIEPAGAATNRTKKRGYSPYFWFKPLQRNRTRHFGLVFEPPQTRLSRSSVVVNVNLLYQFVNWPDFKARVGGLRLGSDRPSRLYEKPSIT